MANRLTKLHEFCDSSHWKHVKSEDNPADVGTRGSFLQDLISNNLWWHGSHLLIIPQANWPEPRHFNPTDIKSKKVTRIHCIIDDHILTRFSSLTRATRVIAYVLRTL